MKKYILIIVILLSNVLFIKGQYSKMVMGEKCPFDTAVAIQITTYRMESKKMVMADSLISNMKLRIINCDSLRLLYFNNNNANISLLSIKTEEIKSKNITINRLKNELQYKQESNWWLRNKKYFVFVSGFISGGAVIHFIKN